MVVLGKITEMQKQGIPTNQIIQSLKEEGVSPKEINEALSQSGVKSEIDQENSFPTTPESNLSNPNPINQIPNPTPNFSDQQTQQGQVIQPATQQTNPSAEMQPSLGSQQPTEIQNYRQPGTIQQDSFQQQESQSQLQPSGYPAEDLKSQLQPTQEFSQYPEYSQYSDYPEYQPSQTTDVETINDIASQIVDEKIKNFKKELAASTKETEEKIKEISNRLNKVETILEELQLAIIRKIGTYGEDIKNISKEMKATQDSFSKIIDPLTDNIELKKRMGHDTHHKKSTRAHSKKSKKESFEDYLR